MGSVMRAPAALRRQAIPARKGRGTIWSHSQAPAWLRAIRDNPGDAEFLREWEAECRRIREEDRRQAKRS